MIQVENLTKNYGAKPAIQDVSFQVEKGEIVGFLGPNAAGKTTTMRVLSCFFPPSSGSAKVAGFDVFDDSKEVRRHVGYMPENPPLYPDMTVDAYLRFVAQIREVPFRQISKRIRDIVERVHIGENRRLRISKLSKGYKQRVGLAQALIHNPQILILDEPTVGLDPKQIIEVRHLIKSLAGDHTILLSTHILPEVSMTCGRVIIIHNGHIVAKDSTEALTVRLQGSERFMMHIEEPSLGEYSVKNIEKIVGKLRKIPEIESVELDSSMPLDQERASVGHYLTIRSAERENIRHHAAKVVIENGWRLYEIRPDRMSLEEVFLQLTTEEDIETSENFEGSESEKETSE
ncbi:MAG: hypothetical protein B6244_06655 [Candidatus Cloacimonetes bacterium 4572_55]|nr:MAG: hypothetical protein B6244_06655 [Candidatus Cloacimonetes bacterium 4572_55]